MQFSKIKIAATPMLYATNISKMTYISENFHMHWLDEQEAFRKKTASEIKQFNNSLDNCKKAIERIKRAFPNVTVIKENSTNFKVSGSGQNYRQWRDRWNDCHSSDTLIIDISFKRNAPVIEFSKEHHYWEIVFFYDSSENSFKYNPPSRESSLFKKELTIERLISITEDSWINIFGWLVSKTGLPIIESLFYE
jgi:hypothetical protein